MFLHAATIAAFALILPAAESGFRAAATLQSPSAVSAADAAPFLGEWTLALDGQNGPATFTLSIRTEKEKVTGDIASEAIGKHPITSLSLADKTLSLGYSFTWEGNPVDAVASLTPDKDGTTRARMDFAGGAYLMTGSATRKEKEPGK